MEQLKRDIIDIGQRLYRNGFVSSNDGNISAKTDEKHILTTPTGLNKGELKRDDLVVVDLKGNVVRGSRKPSSELKMHLYIYEKRQDIKAIVHAHPPYCTGFATAGIPLDKCVLPEVILTIGAMPLAQYATPSTDEIVKSIENLVPASDAVMLANHGAVTLGTDLMDAYWKMERMEHAAKISYIASTLGGEQVLPKQEIDKLVRIRQESGATGPAPVCWSCNDCIGDTCVLHDYKNAAELPSENEISQIVTKILKSLR